MTHAWCSDPSRDAAVRAAEDGRTGPLPTLGECIDGMIPKSGSASTAPEQENKGDGMRPPTTKTASVGSALARIAEAFRCEPDDDDDLVEAARLLVRERDEAVAKAASGGGPSVGRKLAERLGRFADRLESGALDMPSGLPTAASGGGEQPRGWLTEEEREAIDMACQVFNGRHAGFDQRYAAKDVLSNLLARSTPPEVVLPALFSRSNLGDRLLLEQQVRQALAAAGVAVKEVQ
jgi:hypothetical protein